MSAGHLQTERTHSPTNRWITPPSLGSSLQKGAHTNLDVFGSKWGSFATEPEKSRSDRAGDCRGVGHRHW